MNPYARRGKAAFRCGKKSCGIPGSKNRESLYQRREVRIYSHFRVLLLSLKDMTLNYSKLAQAALIVHEQLLTVILTSRERKNRFWLHNIVKKKTAPTRSLL